MAINLNKMKDEFSKRQGNDDFWEIPQGETAVYICPPARDDDEFPYWEIKLHYGFKKVKAKGGGMEMRGLAYCLDPYQQAIFDSPHLAEALKAVGKDPAILKSGCPICEEMDKGKLGEDSKRQSRWLWVVMPMKTRATSNESFRAWNQPDHPVALNGGWKVWNGIMDQFGNAGDITKPDQAMLVRIQRDGAGKTTAYTIQADLETARTPLKLSKSSITAVVEATRPGGRLDPYKLIAGMMRTRADVEKDLNQPGPEEPGYEESPAAPQSEKSAADKSKFAPPGQKAKPPKSQSNGAGSEHPDIDIKQLTAERGTPPPSCFRVDPDPGEDICQKCPWKVECATFVGVPVPPDPVNADQHPDNAIAASEVEAKECEVGKQYVMGDGVVVVYKGPAKGKQYFTSIGDKPVIYKLADGDAVTVSRENAQPPAAADGDAELDALEKELAAAKPKGKKSAAAKPPAA